MSVNNRSNIWGLPQFQNENQPSKPVPVVFDSKAEAKMKRNQRARSVGGRRVTKINIQLSETQRVMVDYRIENQAVSMPDPVKLRSRLKSRLGRKHKTIKPKEDFLETTSKNTSQLIEIEPTSPDYSILKMPEWSLDQVQVRFLGYLADNRQPKNGQEGDFYLTQNGEVWLRTKNDWAKI